MPEVLAKKTTIPINRTLSGIHLCAIDAYDSVFFDQRICVTIC